MSVPSSLAPLGLLGLVLATGCAKLNPAFQETEGGTGSGKHGTDGSQGTTGTENTTAVGTTPLPSGGATTFGSDSDHSTTKLSTEGGGESVSQSAGGTESTGPAESGDTQPPWTEECALVQPLVPCSMVEGSGQGFSCVLDFNNALEFGCGPDFVSTIPLVLAEGVYVMGAIGVPDAEYAVLESGSEVLECSLDNPTFVIEAGVPIVELEVWNTIPTSFPLWLRRVDGLCDVPDDCCEPSGAAAIRACGNEDLRECVIDADILCEESWDFICTDRAMFACGANCT